MPEWHTDSTKQQSTVATYAKYQVQTYVDTKGSKIKTEKKNLKHFFSCYLSVSFWYSHQYQCVGVAAPNQKLPTVKLRVAHQSGAPLFEV